MALMPFQTQTPTSEAEEATPESTVESLEGMSSDLEVSITEFAEGASQGDVLAVINSMATAAEFNKEALGRIASRMGTEPEAIQEKVSSIRAGFEAQARAAVESHPESHSWGNRLVS